MCKRITYDVFDPMVGVPMYTTRYTCIARLLAWWYDLDWCTTNSGWLYTIDSTCEEVEYEDDNYMYLVRPAYK
jgi:hypothetical protein